MADAATTGGLSPTEEPFLREAKESSEGMTSALQPFLGTAGSFWKRYGLAQGCATLGFALMIFAIATAITDPSRFTNRTMSFTALLASGVVLIGLSILTFQISQWRLSRETVQAMGHVADSFESTKTQLVKLQEDQTAAIERIKNKRDDRDNGMND